MRKIKIIFMMILGLSLFCNYVSAEPIINVDIDPNEPAPVSQITITASISSEKDINKVYVEIQECKTDLCFQKDNVTMTKVNNDYQKQYELSRSESTYFKYSIAVLFTDGSWYNQSEKTEVTLKVSNGGTNGGNNGNNDSPGFELIILISAISLTILLLRRKR